MAELDDWVATLKNYQPRRWPPQEWNGILCEIGRIVFSWNCFERSTTSILNILIRGEHRAIIATAHMNSATQMDAMRTLANEFLVGEQRDTILHIIQLFERLRERRNYYIHAFDNISGLPGILGPAMANLGAWSARGRLKRHEMRVDENHLAREAHMMHLANHYMALVHNHLKYTTNADYAKLPEKFPLPEKLTKPARFVLPSDEGKLGNKAK